MSVQTEYRTQSKNEVCKNEPDTQEILKTGLYAAGMLVQVYNSGVGNEGDFKEGRDGKRGGEEEGK